MIPIIYHVNDFNKNPFLRYQFNMFLRYGPRKIEVVSLQPHIAVMHNFITNSESDELISKAGPKLRRSSIVTNNKGNSSAFDESRTSEQAWLNEEMSGAAKRVTARLDGFLDVEATSTEHSELYQGRYQANAH